MNTELELIFWLIATLIIIAFFIIIFTLHPPTTTYNMTTLKLVS